MEYFSLVLGLLGSFVTAVPAFFQRLNKKKTIASIGLSLAIFGFFLNGYLEKKHSLSKKYETIKHINSQGHYVPPGSNIFVGGISLIEENMMASTKRNDIGKYEPLCDAQTVSRMNAITKNYPLYPFSYIVLYQCTGQQSYTAEAKKHTAIIVSLTDHASDYDDLWKQIK